MKIQNKKAFTLVEMIIVITILAILTTILFMSYQSYVGDTRDSSRITSLKKIYDRLTISYVKKQIYPTPDDYLEITSVSKQGYVGTTVSQTIRGEGFKDPKDNTRYLYSLDYTGKKIQLSGYLENKDKIILSRKNNLFANQVFAGNIDYINRYIYTFGDNVGILLKPETNAPINETIPTGSINLQSDSQEYKVAFSSTGTITGTGEELLKNISIIQNSCVLGNTVVTSGGRINAYNTNTVAYNETCTAAVVRTCTNGVLSGDISYKYDTCTPVNALNCTETTYNGYSIPVINHNVTQSVSKVITGGTLSITTTCTNGVLAYGVETTTCSTGYTNISNVCTAIGSVSTLPGLSCFDIKTKLTSSTDGVYWIKPDTNPAFQVYCDMTTDGGGLILLFSNNIGNYRYGSTFYDGLLASNNTFTYSGNLLNSGNIEKVIKYVKFNDLYLINDSNRTNYSKYSTIANSSFSTKKINLESWTIKKGDFVCGTNNILWNQIYSGTRTKTHVLLGCYNGSAYGDQMYFGLGALSLQNGSLRCVVGLGCNVDITIGSATHRGSSIGGEIFIK